MNLDTFFRDIVREIVREELLSEKPPPLELISIEKAAEECECGKSVIEDLVRECETNGFPAVQLGVRTIRIDRNRLRLWLNAGGLKNKQTDDAENIAPFGIVRKTG